MTVSLFSLPRVDRSADTWETRSLRSLLTPRSERDRPDLPLLTVARERGVFVRSDEDANHNSIPEDLGNYKVARSGDLVINKMKAWQGSLGLAPVDGIVSPAYFVFEADFDVPRFGEYLLRSRPYVAKFGAASDGVRIGQWDLDIPRMRNIEVSLPKADEQAAIVKYLAHASARINKAIAAKHRLGGLLEEQRRVRTEAILHREGPRYERLGFHADIATGFPFRSEDFLPGFDAASVRLLRGVNVGVGATNWNDVVSVDTSVARSVPKFELRRGDLVLGMDRPVISGGVRVAQIQDEDAGSLLVQRVARLRPKSTLDSEYLMALFHSDAFERYLHPIFTGISVPHLSPKQIRDFPIPLPSLIEQREIVRRIARDTSSLRDLLARGRREISLLQEFRTRLVTDVVTGQVDVRAIAASLPDTPTQDTDLDSMLEDDLADVLDEGEE